MPDNTECFRRVQLYKSMTLTSNVLKLCLRSLLKPFCILDAAQGAIASPERLSVAIEHLTAYRSWFLLCIAKWQCRNAIGRQQTFREQFVEMYHSDGLLCSHHKL